MACSRRCCSRRALNGEGSSPISGTRCCAWATHLVRGMMLEAVNAPTDGGRALLDLSGRLMAGWGEGKMIGSESGGLAGSGSGYKLCVPRQP